VRSPEHKELSEALERIERELADLRTVVSGGQAQS
jgi:ribosomal protein L29